MEKPSVHHGYLTYTEWAERVSKGYQEAEEKSVSVGDFAAATYWTLKREQHEREVREQQESYRGL